MYEDDGVEYLSKEEAEARAREIAIRDLQIGSSLIRCVAYFEGFFDYALVEFHQEPEGWVQVFTCLPSEMRLENEVIQDSKIKNLADAGNLISAIRLYRAKYGVGLAEAKNAIDTILTLASHACAGRNNVTIGHAKRRLRRLVFMSNRNLIRTLEVSYNSRYTTTAYVPSNGIEPLQFACKTKTLPLRQLGKCEISWLRSKL